MSLATLRRARHLSSSPRLLSLDNQGAVKLDKSLDFYGRIEHIHRDSILSWTERQWPYPFFLGQYGRSTYNDSSDEDWHSCPSPFLCVWLDFLYPWKWNHPNLPGAQRWSSTSVRQLDPRQCEYNSTLETLRQCQGTETAVQEVLGEYHMNFKQNEQEKDRKKKKGQ